MPSRFSALRWAALVVSAPLFAAEPRVVKAARDQVGVTLAYDPAYRRIAYPGGDVPKETGVCADVVVRALRGRGSDLQKLVHEDMAAHFSEYPKDWGLKRPDANIDHRRVPNLRVWFRRAGWSLPVSAKAGDYAPGDIVTWDLPRGLKHIGVVSDRKSPAGAPLVIHNIGSGAKEEDVLFSWKITGRYRVPAEAEVSGR